MAAGSGRRPRAGLPATANGPSERRSGLKMSEEVRVGDAEDGLLPEEPGPPCARCGGAHASSECPHYSVPNLKPTPEAEAKRRQESADRPHREYQDGLRATLLQWLPCYIIAIVGGVVMLVMAFEPSHDADGCEKCGKWGCATYPAFAPQCKESYPWLLSFGACIILLPSVFFCVILKLWLGGNRRGVELKTLQIKALAGGD